MDPYDFGAGLINAVSRGTGAYFDARDKREQLNAEMAAKGLIHQDGKWVRDPQEVARERRKARQATLLELYKMGRKPGPDSIDEEGFLTGEVPIDEEYLRAKAAMNPLGLLNAQIKQRELEKPSLTPGQEAMDKEFAKQIVEWEQMGGYAGAQKNLSRIGGAAGKLESGEVKTGGGRGLLPKFARDVVMPDLSAVQEDIESAAQNTMRATLGAQFTEKEGMQILARTFNPNLPPEENLRRAKLLMNELQSIAEAKNAAMEYFRQNGTLKGYQGPTSFSLPVERVDSLYGAKAGPVTKTPQLLPKAGAAQFPRKVRNAQGDEATVSNEQELKEAMAEGFR